MSYPKLRLKKNKGQSLERRHPWIFSGAIATDTTDLNDGDKVHIINEKQEVVATGHFSKGSIAVRIVSFSKVQIDTTFYSKRITEAYHWREISGLAEAADTNAYRLVHAEGDQLPGLVIDYYNGVAVVQTHSKGMFFDFEFIHKALDNLYLSNLKMAVHKPADEKRVMDLPKSENPTVDVLEHGCAFRINYQTGQKTGFFLDQRENRKLLTRYAKNKKILNAFSYSGGFSIYALKAGASEVHSLDSSEKAIDLVQENLVLNGLENSNHKSIQADALVYLNDPKTRDEKYDIIILDPPAFAKRRSSRHRAVQAYKRLNSRALRLLEPGGILVTFSCSQVVTPDLFYKTIASAAIEAARPVRILHHLHQPEDHPVSIFHPEGEYLKGLVLAVD